MQIGKKRILLKTLKEILYPSLNKFYINFLCDTHSFDYRVLQIYDCLALTAAFFGVLILFYEYGKTFYYTFHN